MSRERSERPERFERFERFERRERPELLDERLDAMLAPLRDHAAQLDELAQARVRVRLEATLASADAAADVQAVQGGWRSRFAVGIGFAAAAAIVVIGLLAALRRGETGNSSMATASGHGIGSTPDGIGSTPHSNDSTANRNGNSRGIGSTATAIGSTTNAGGIAASRAPGAVAGGAPIVVAAGESTHVTIDDAAVTVYGPGTLSSTPEGTEVRAAGIVVDRTRGDAPWSMRYHGVKIVAMRATFVLDHGTTTRATVMRGEIELQCPSGTRTIHSGDSGTCEPVDDAGPTPAAQQRTSALEKPAATDALPHATPVAPNAQPPSTRDAMSRQQSATRDAMSTKQPATRDGSSTPQPPTRDGQSTQSLKTRDAMSTQQPATRDGPSTQQPPTREAPSSKQPAAIAGDPRRLEPVARLKRPEPGTGGPQRTRELIVDDLRPLPPPPDTGGYAAAEAALRSGDLDAARTALLSVIDAAPDSLDAAMALLDLARLDKTRGEIAGALGYLERLDRHPRRAAVATAAAHLRATLARAAIIQRPLRR